MTSIIVNQERRVRQIVKVMTSIIIICHVWHRTIIMINFIVKIITKTIAIARIVVRKTIITRTLFAVCSKQEAEKWCDVIRRLRYVCTTYFIITTIIIKSVVIIMVIVS